MRYAKLNDSSIAYAPNPIRYNGLWYGNPPAEILRAEGYKPVCYTEPQGEAPEGYAWRETWTDNGSEIVQGWEAVELPPEMDISPEEALDILLGGEPS